MSKHTLKIDDQIVKALDLKLIRRLICKTDKGELELVIRKGENRYFLTLDAVPLETDINKELMELLFPVKLEVPQVNKEPIEIKKKLGRPAKTK
jgi:hypothetical protein